MGKSEKAINDSRLVNIINDKNSSSREKQSAFDELFSNYEKQMTFFFVGSLSKHANKEDASDLVMVTFEKAYDNLSSFDDNKGVFSTWIYKIAKNTLIDYVRKERFEVLSIDRLSSKTSEYNDGMDFQIESDSRNPEQDAIHKQDIDAVHLAIDSIENDFVKDLMRCRYIDDLSFEETAEKLNVENNSTLRVTVKRGIALLRDTISQ